MRTPFAVALFLFLSACEQPVIAPLEGDCERDPKRAPLCLYSEPEAIRLTANKPLEHGSITLGSEAADPLVVKSEYCATPGCVPSQNGYIRLTFPDEPKANYGRVIEVEVVSGRPFQGRALFTLQGEEASREALLQVKP